MSSESLIQGLHEECKAAQAQAAAWEEIAMELADWSRDFWVEAVRMVDGSSHWRWVEISPDGPDGNRCGEPCDTPRAALLAWHAAQKK